MNYMPALTPDNITCLVIGFVSAVLIDILASFLWPENDNYHHNDEENKDDSDYK